MFTDASCGMTMPFLRSSLWPFPMWTALPPAEYYGPSPPRRPAQRTVRLARDTWLVLHGPGRHGSHVHCVSVVE